MSHLTLYASHLQQLNIHLSASSNTLLLERLCLFMDLDHLKWSEVEPDGPDLDSSSLPPPGPRIIGKTAFRPNLDLLSVLNPRRLVVEGCEPHLEKAPDFASYFVHRDTLMVICTKWKRLAIIQYSNVLLFSTYTDSPDCIRHSLIGNRLSPTEHRLRPIQMQFRLSTRYDSRLPVLYYVHPRSPPITGRMAHIGLLHYLRWILKKQTVPNRVSLCCANDAVRNLVQQWKEIWPEKWLDDFRICSMEEAEAEERTLCARGNEVDKMEDGLHAVQGGSMEQGT